MDLEGIIQIGQIVNSHGIKGEVKVIPLTEDLEIVENVDQLIIFESNQQKNLKVKKVRQVKKHWLILFAEVQDMTSALQLKGRGVFIEEDKVKPLMERALYASWEHIYSIIKDDPSKIYEEYVSYVKY